MPKTTAGHLHPVRPSPRHRALRRSEAVRDRRQQARARNCPANVTGETVLLDLLDAVIDRAADILERIGMEVDRVSHDIFEPDGRRADQPLSYKDILKAIGRKGDLTSKVRESLVSIGRLLLFLANEADGMRWPKDVRAAAQGDAARRAVAVGPRHLSDQQDHLPARRHARRRHHRAEQHHQDILDRRRRR